MAAYEEIVGQIRKKGLLVTVDKRAWGVVIEIKTRDGGPSWTKAMSTGQVDSGETGQLEYILDGRIVVTNTGVIVNESPMKIGQKPMPKVHKTVVSTKDMAPKKATKNTAKK